MMVRRIPCSPQMSSTRLLWYCLSQAWKWCAHRAARFATTLGAIFLSLGAGATFAAVSFTHFEARHTHSIGLTPDGTRLLALNTNDGRLSVFDISNASNAVPVLIKEIPVGLEPISLRARTNDEVWVVSEVGDSVSVVSLSRGAVLEVLSAPDEPADVVFAQGKAFVSCARNNLVRVFSAERQPLGSIMLDGLAPRALTTDAAGTKVYAAFLHSGNNTTVLPGNQAPPQPSPTNQALPTPPRTALIVSTSDPRINYTVADRDVAEIDAATHEVVRYFGGTGTSIFDVAVHPATGDIWVSNTEALNLIRFEPELRGHFIDNRLTRIAQGSGAPTIFDLNPGIDYGTLPNPVAQASALAQPTSLVFASGGANAWVTAFASDRIAKVAASSGAVVSRIDLRPAGQGSRQMRGPRALVLHEALQRLYVLNKLSNTISVVSTASEAVVAEIPVGSFDPMPAAVREGRGFLFDARLSGNGTMSCASCHLDADRDGLAWDLGDPGGEMVVVVGANIVVHDFTPRNRSLHPMKGPLTTQTLRGMTDGAPFHWRGDRPTLQSFNITFDRLMGGAELSTAADIDALAAYLLTLRHHPNPNLQPDGSMPPMFLGGNPARGQQLFNTHENHCAVCHEGRKGTNNNLDLRTEVGSTQFVKNPPLQTTYQKLFFNPIAGQESRSGFGLLKDGTGAANALPTVHPYILDQLVTPEDFADVRAFVLLFATDTTPLVGHSRVVTNANANDPIVTAELTRHEAQSGLGSSDLVVQGLVNGRQRSFYFDSATQQYRPDNGSEAGFTRAGLLAMLGPDDAATFLSTIAGDGPRRGGDRDGDGVRDYDELLPLLAIERFGTNLRLSWPAAATDWLLESATMLSGPWTAVTLPRNNSGASLTLDVPLGPAATGFYHLNRTW